VPTLLTGLATMEPDAVKMCLLRGVSAHTGQKRPTVIESNAVLDSILLTARAGVVGARSLSRDRSPPAEIPDGRTELLTRQMLVLTASVERLEQRLTQPPQGTPPPGSSTVTSKADLEAAMWLVGLYYGHP
jgi:hypothetical protein